MKNKSWLAILLVMLLNIAGCALNRAVSLKPNSDQLDREDINLIFFGTLSLPLKFDNKSIWIEKGPIVIASNETNIAYRIIDKQELEFIGTIETPYEFFKNAFNKPSDHIEQLFLEGLGKIDNKSYYKTNNVEIYILEINNNLKIYILSPALDFVVEVTSKNNSKEFVDKIISKTHLK
ncbi:MAG: hypothetical protein L3J75_03955 [Methylococcaceae bacterium]|nr:hypothetical protein [Methylococcaceae bacterium]